MPKVTITVEYDDGTTKSHSAELPAMSVADLDQMIDDAATQAGYKPIVPITTVVEVEGKEDETVTEDGPNPKTALRHLCGWLFKTMNKLVTSHRASRSAEVVRQDAVKKAADLEAATKVE